MTVHVADGIVIIAGVVAAVAATDLTIAAADATQDRIDAIVVNSSGTASVLQGTLVEIGTVLPPDTTGYALLAYVTVVSQQSPTYTGTITSAAIQDERTQVDLTTPAQAFIYQFVSGAGSNVDPGAGKFRFDSASNNTIAKLYVSYTAANHGGGGGLYATGTQSWFQNLLASGMTWYMLIFQRSDASVWWIGKVASFTDHTTYAEIGITYLIQSAPATASPTLATDTLDAVLTFGGFVPASGANVQVFTTTGSSTWTKPAGVALVQAVVVSAGGGGGGGARNAGGGGGGVGGGGGARTERMFAASDLGATETVVVGAGGTAGTGQTGSSGAGGNGGDGGSSSFANSSTGRGVLLFGGKGGLGGLQTPGSQAGGNGGGDVTDPGAFNGASLGQALGASAAVGGSAEFGGGAGGGVSATAAFAGGDAVFGGPGGGGGASGGASRAGAKGGGIGTYASGNGASGGASGGANAGGNGTNGDSTKCGQGGGGGGVGTATAGGVGGNGGTVGGGGGGGAGGGNNLNGGNGGKGGDGLVVIIAV